MAISEETVVLVPVTFGGLSTAPLIADATLTNVSYDPTRELYQDINAAFAEYWKARTGQTVRVQQWHGGSGKQAQSVIDGLEADVVTLGLGHDVEAVQDAGLITSGPAHGGAGRRSPYTSTIVFLVRQGNPKRIEDWDDLLRRDVQIVTPHPKTSSGGRWNYLAAWAYGKMRQGGNDAQARWFVEKLYRKVAALDAAARGATKTFVQRGVGDVLLAWENEALLARQELGPARVDIVAPSISILAEPPVAVVDRVVEKRRTRPVAEAYLEFLYTPEGQHIIARNFYRPSMPAVAREYLDRFPRLELATIDDFGGWRVAHRTHFADGGTFDQIWDSAKAT